MNLLQVFQFSLALSMFTIPQTEPARGKRLAGTTKVAKPGQFPFAVFLYWFLYFGGDDYPRSRITRFKCTSNLLSPNYVLTAAHCYQHLIYKYRNYSSEDDFVSNLTMKHAYTITRAGTIDGFQRETGWQDRRGDMLFVPGAYARPSTMFDMDIAIVRIPVAFIVDDPRLSKVAIARVSEVPGLEDYRDCLTAGYGYVNGNEMQLVKCGKQGEAATGFNKLRFYQVKFALSNFCKYLQQRLDGRVIYFDEFYGCARSVGTVMNSTYATGCFGDAGGPLVCSGLLTAILVQRREREPCDFYTSETAFTMYTLLGASDVQAWLRTHLDMAPLVPLPPWDPWDVTEPPLEELRARVGEGMKNGGVGTDKNEESVYQTSEDEVEVSERKLKTEEFRAKKGAVKYVGDIRDDDPDFLRLLALIRGGGVEGDPVRRKRQEARWQLREAMAKDLLRATRDLDPGALDRFGMGADVLTRDEVGEDAWAREVWEDAFEDDRVK